MARHISGRQPLRRDFKKAFEKTINQTAQTFERLLSSGYEYGDLMAELCHLKAPEKADWKLEVGANYEAPYRDLIKSLLHCALLRKDASGKPDPAKIVFQWPDENAPKQIAVTFTKSGHYRVKIFGFVGPHA